MTIPLGATITVTLINPVDADRFGDPTGPATETSVPGCWMWTDLGTENTDHADTVTAIGVLLAPAGTDIRALSRVRIAGQTWEVDGDPLDRQSPFTAAAMVEARLKKVTG